MQKDHLSKLIGFISLTLIFSSCATTKYYVARDDLVLPKTIISPHLDFRYVEVNDHFDISKVSELARNEELENEVLEEFILPAFTKICSDTVELSKASVKEIDNAAIISQILLGLDRVIHDDYFNELVFDRRYESSQSINLESVEFDRVVFVVMGGVYIENYDRDFSEWSRQFLNFTGDTPALYKTTDKLPFFNLCLGVYNLNSAKFEVLHYRTIFLDPQNFEDSLKEILDKSFKKIVPK